LKKKVTEINTAGKKKEGSLDHLAVTISSSRAACSGDIEQQFALGGKSSARSAGFYFGSVARWRTLLSHVRFVS
jgi:hypothetical protein